MKPSKETRRAEGRDRPERIPQGEARIRTQSRVILMPNLERVNEAAKQAVQTRFTSLDALHTAIMSQRVNWVLDADIRSFFDSVDHEWLLRCCITSIRLPFTGHLDDRSGRQAQVSMG